MSRVLPVNRFTTTAQGLVPAPGTATGLFLRDDGTWGSAGGFVSPLTTKGDVLGFDTVANRIPVGADGTVLTADSTQALGVRWTAAAGSGTVTSAALADGSAVPIYTISGSPVVAAGTLTYTLNTQTANKVFAGPTSGGAAQPAFRSLVAADFPSLVGLASSLTTLTQAGGASQVYTIPAGAQWVQIVLIGGGGGGGSGSRVVSGTQASGGGGGGGGGISSMVLRASDLGASVTVTFSNAATGGNGGAQQAGAAPIIGNAGVAGSNVSFGAYLIAYGGGSGAAGNDGGSTANGGTSGGGSTASGTTGGNSTANAAGLPGTSIPAAATTYSSIQCGNTGAGAGGGLATVPVVTNGGNGGGNAAGAYVTLTGGIGGTSGTPTGGNGNPGSGTSPATGGGGGASATGANNGGPGGTGGNYGAGGGGGGCVLSTGAHSGAGGNGGPAACIIIAW